MIRVKDLPTIGYVINERSQKHGQDSWAGDENLLACEWRKNSFVGKAKFAIRRAKFGP